ncbi:MAG: TatA/E family twin arginine-targeting protein translocase [Desulfobulbaceae bacterium]
MFGIGLPEMIVILAVALIVVGPDKLPDMARSVAKWMFELKKTVNQVRESLADEEDLLDSVRSDLRKSGDELKGGLLESDHFTFHEPGGPGSGNDEVIDIGEQPEKGEEKADERAEDGSAEPGDESKPNPSSV